MYKNFEAREDNMEGDPGILAVLGDRIGVLAIHNELAREPAMGAAQRFALSRRERVVVDFKRHPIRDIGISAVAFTVMGFAAGSATATYRHRR